MPPLVEIRSLRKRFGAVVAVDDLNFAVGRGEVLGFLGPNGAGKSTTMKIIAGFLPPTAGTAIVGGEDIRELGKAGVPVVSLRQDGLDYFDIHHTADDTLDKIDPKELNQAVAVWTAVTYLTAASDVDFRNLAATAK